MTDAEKAYAFAEQLIAEAKESGATKLSFVRDETRALERIPDSIAELPHLEELVCDSTRVSDLSPLSDLRDLQRLYLAGTPVSDLTPLSDLQTLTLLGLDGTPVSDLSPLSGLTGLRALWLDRTPVSDLSPLLPLTKLAEELGGFGLTFRNCEAALADDQIDEISKIKDPAERARTLFEYLREQTKARTPDRLVKTQDDPDRLEIVASSPTEAERDERLKQVLHEQLQERSKTLAQQAGNQFFRLAARARGLVEQVEREFEGLDMLMLHLAIEDLREMNALGREDEDSGDFPPEVMLALADVLRLGPGLTLGHPDVDLLVERANRRRAAPPVPEAELQAQDEMSDALANDELAVGDRLRALEKAVAHGDSAEKRETQKAAHRSVLWKVAVLAGTVSEAAGVTVMSEALVTLIKTNWPILEAVSATYGAWFAEWFGASVTQAKDFADLTAQYVRHRKNNPKV